MLFILRCKSLSHAAEDFPGLTVVWRNSAWKELNISGKCVLKSKKVPFLCFSSLWKTLHFSHRSIWVVSGVILGFNSTTYFCMFAMDSSSIHVRVPHQKDSLGSEWHLRFLSFSKSSGTLKLCRNRIFHKLAETYNSGNISIRVLTYEKTKNSINKMLPQWALNLIPQPFESDALLSKLQRYVSLM